MKARELAELLLTSPDSEVTHFEYTGGCTPVLAIVNADHFSKGYPHPTDGGDFMDQNEKFSREVWILKSY